MKNVIDYKRAMSLISGAVPMNEAEAGLISDYSQTCAMLAADLAGDSELNAIASFWQSEARSSNYFTKQVA